MAAASTLHATLDQASDHSGTVKPGAEDSIPATSIIASFIANADKSLLKEVMRSKIFELVLDMIGITAAAANSSASSQKVVAAIATLAPASGHTTVLTKGSNYPPHIAALLNATFGHSLDFDDTHATSTLHPGVTTIWTAFAQAEAVEATDMDLILLAISVGYEITCRLGRELSFAAYARGFHNTSTAGVFGAVATLAVLKRLNKRTTEMALGLAGSRAAGSMQYLDNGSHNKRLHPGFACHDAFVCVALAEQGVTGATKVFEGKMGFLTAYSPSKEMHLGRLLRGLGEQWIFLDTSLKPFPACRMTHGSIEMAEIAAHRQTAPKTNLELVDEIERIEVRLRTVNMSLVGDPSLNKIHPSTEVDAQFSIYFQIAHSYLYGCHQGMRAYERLSDTEIYTLSDKIVCKVDDSDMELVDMGSRLIFEYKDGHREELSNRYPLGEPEHPLKLEDVVKKFRSCIDPVYGAKRGDEILGTVNHFSHGEGSIKELMALLA